MSTPDGGHDPSSQRRDNDGWLRLRVRTLADAAIGAVIVLGAVTGATWNQHKGRSRRAKA